MGWRGDDGRERANDQESKRHPVHLGFFVFAVVLFFVWWVAASFG
jgi:hypothetical protein